MPNKRIRQLLGQRKIGKKTFVCTDIFYKKRPARKYAGEIRRVNVNVRVIPSKSKERTVFGVYIEKGKAWTI